MELEALLSDAAGGFCERRSSVLLRAYLMPLADYAWRHVHHHLYRPVAVSAQAVCYKPTRGGCYNPTRGGWRHPPFPSCAFSIKGEVAPSLVPELNPQTGCGAAGPECKFARSSELCVDRRRKVEALRQGKEKL